MTGTGSSGQSALAGIEGAAQLVLECATSIMNGLGTGYPEHVLQSALSIEFRERGIPYLREPHIELLYHGVSVGLDRPDFCIWPDSSDADVFPALVLEVKQAETTLDEHRQQLINYLRAIRGSSDSRLSKIRFGVLLRFPKTDRFSSWEGVAQRALALECWTHASDGGAFTRILSFPDSWPDQ